MFVAIFAFNVNSCALDISLYFVCEKKTNKSWHRKKAYRGHFLIGQKPHCLLLSARIKESYDYSLKKLTDHQNLMRLIFLRSYLEPLECSCFFMQASYGWANRVNLIPGI